MENRLCRRLPILRPVFTRFYPERISYLCAALRHFAWKNEKTMQTGKTAPALEELRYKRIFGIAFPIILSTLAQNVIALADTIFLGNLGEVELGAAALASIFYQVLVMVVFGFGVGAQILMARRRGQGQFHSIGCIFQHALWFTLFCSALCWGAFQLFGEKLLPLLVSSPDILQAVSLYLEARIYGVPFAFAIVAFNAFYVAIARTRTISIATLVMGAVNVVLDYNLIFGAMGFPRMEMAGAAVASVIAEAVGLALYVLLTAISPYRKQFLPFGRFRFKIGIVGNLIGIAYPVMIQYFLSFANYFLFFLFVESLGQRSLAVANITRSMYVLFLLPIWGFASTTASLTSFLCGRKQTGQIGILVRRSILLVVLCITVLVAAYFPFHQSILGIFTQDESLARESFIPTLVVIAAAYLTAFAQIVFNTILGKGNTKAGFFIESANLILYFLYGWIFIHLNRCSVPVAFGTEVTYAAGLLLISLAYLALKKRQGKSPAPDL